MSVEPWGLLQITFEPVPKLVVSSTEIHRFSFDLKGSSIRELYCNLLNCPPACGPATFFPACPLRADPQRLTSSSRLVSARARWARTGHGCAARTLLCTRDLAAHSIGRSARRIELARAIGTVDSQDSTHDDEGQRTTATHRLLD